MAETATKKKQIRVLMWGTPRSLSTALFRAMWNRKSCRCFPEPYGLAYFFGSERRSKWYAHMDPIEGCDYAGMKREMYEGEYEEDEVFIKDFPTYLYRQELHKPEDMIPSGYVHTFMIRHPRDCLTSGYKLFLKKEVPGWTEWEFGFAGFKELWQFYNIIKEKQPDPLIIHADDLIANPEATLRLYCERTGLEFQESMLHWKQDDGMDTKLFNLFPFLKVFTGTVLATSGFGTQPSHSEHVELPPEIEQDIAANTIYYDKLMQFVTRTTTPPAQK